MEKQTEHITEEPQYSSRRLLSQQGGRFMSKKLLAGSFVLLVLLALALFGASAEPFSPGRAAGKLR